MNISVDFNLHGFVGIRLLNAGPREEALVERQLGPLQASLPGAPDLVIHFVDQLEPQAPLRYLGVDDVAYNEHEFFVLRGKQKSAVKVKLPFDQLGDPCEIVCQRGLPAVPLLIPIVNLIALRHGLLPMHASAFTYRGTSVLITGWSKGGKTETLLGFLARGGQYVGDEWLYLTADGEQMFGIPEPMRVWHWHLNELPAFRRLVPRRDRLRLLGLEQLTNCLQWAATGRIRRLAQRVAGLVERQKYVHLPPASLHEGGQLGPMMARPDVILLLGNQAASEISVREIAAEEVAERMLHSLEQERAELLEMYRKFRFAMPGRQNYWIENAHELFRERLYSVLASKPAWAVDHPYPVSIERLCDAVEPLVASSPRPVAALA